MGAYDKTHVGFRVFTDIPRPDKGLLKRLAYFAPLNLADAMHGFGLMDSGVAPLYLPIPRVVGPALTVKITPGDGLMLRKALALAQRGDVLVVDGFGEKQRAIAGGNCCIDMKKKGLVGLIVDGAVRDVQEARDLKTPVFARAPTGRPGTTYFGKGEVNVPVSCGGVVVMPGDFIVAAEEGIVVVPRADVEAVMARTLEMEAAKGRPEQLKRRLKSAQANKIHGHGQGLEKALADGNCSVVEGTWPL